MKTVKGNDRTNTRRGSSDGIQRYVFFDGATARSHSHPWLWTVAMDRGLIFKIGLYFGRRWRDAPMSSIFLHRECCILDGQPDSMPIHIIKTMPKEFSNRNQRNRLESLWNSLAQSAQSVRTVPTP